MILPKSSLDGGLGGKLTEDSLSFSKSCLCILNLCTLFVDLLYPLCFCNNAIDSSQHLSHTCVLTCVLMVSTDDLEVHSMPCIFAIINKCRLLKGNSSVSGILAATRLVVSLRNISRSSILP